MQNSVKKIARSKCQCNSANEQVNDVRVLEVAGISWPFR
jgi:hypothetical protein